MLEAMPKSAAARRGKEGGTIRALPGMTLAMFARGLFAAAGAGAAAATTPLFSPELIVGHHHPPRPALPEYLEGRPEHWQARSYIDDTPIVPHTAEGPGLRAASTGVPASFTIRLASSSNNNAPAAAAKEEEEEEAGGSPATARLAATDDNSAHGAPGVPVPEGEWDYNVDKKRFVYVWVAGEDSVFVAEVENNLDGTLTATYEAPFPGRYLVHVEDVDLRIKDDKLERGRPIVGSPFSLTVSGEPAVRVGDLPVCGSSGNNGGGDGDDEEAEVASEYWRAGSWVSSNLASPEHGVLRDGWVFQPKDCAYEAFSYDDLMVLAGLEEPTWLLALGNSILRGVFLTLVDMALARGQKDAFATSVLAKCWGFSDVRIGNLRLTYQDLRLYTVTSVEDATVCNDEKLASGSTAAYVSAAELFLKDTIFREGQAWPSVIWAPSNMIDSDAAPNLQISVLMNALPSSWQGSLVMLDHLYGYGYGWNTGNPTMGTLGGVKPVNEFSPKTPDSGVGRMARYRRRDPRVSFVSAFPIYQARLFENEKSRMGHRCYGCSIHYHYLSDGPHSPEAYGGAKMVHSAVTETLANLMITKAVGTKAALHDKAAAESASSSTAAAEKRRAEVGKQFELCSDCPASLVPLHIKPVPRTLCNTTSALPGNASVGSAWDNELCPEWCMAAEPDSRAWKGSGLVDVRVCTSGLSSDGGGGGGRVADGGDVSGEGGGRG